MTSERDPVLMEKARAAYDDWWNGDEPFTKSNSCELLHDFAQEQRREAWREACESLALTFEANQREYESGSMVGHGSAASIARRHAGQAALSQARTNTNTGTGSLTGIPTEEIGSTGTQVHPEKRRQWSAPTEKMASSGNLQPVPASPADELLREVVAICEEHAKLMRFKADDARKQMHDENRHLREDKFSAMAQTCDFLAEKIRALTAAREYLDKADVGSSLPSSVKDGLPVQAGATSPGMDGTSPAFGGSRDAAGTVPPTSAPSSDAVAGWIPKALDIAKAHNPSVCGLINDGFIPWERVRRLIHTAYTAHVEASAPRSTEAVERAARRVLSVFEVARSPHGAPSCVIDPRGGADALCALMDAVESRPARSMATEGAPCAQHKWESKRRGGSPSDESSDERVIVCRECGMEWNGEDDPTAAELSQQEIDTLVTATVARGRDEPQRAPFPGIFAIMYPRLVAVARAHGYALAVHGSMARDLDLIAVPWVKKCADPQKLIEALYGRVGSVHLEGPASKPHGRLGWCIHLGGGPYIDVSVCPPTSHVAGGGETFTAEEQRNAHENFEAWNALTNMLIEEGIEFGDEEGGAMACARNIVQGIKRRLAEPTPPASASSAVGEFVEAAKVAIDAARTMEKNYRTNWAAGFQPPIRVDPPATALIFASAAAAFDTALAALSATRGEAGEAEWHDDEDGCDYKIDKNARVWSRYESDWHPAYSEANGAMRRRLLSLTRAPSREGEKP